MIGPPGVRLSIESGPLVGPGSDTSSQALENAARGAFESRAGRKLTDAEWGQQRARLLEFVTILLGWDQKAGNTMPTRLGNVEVLCQREP